MLQVLPFAGAAIGAGFNAYFMDAVCATARNYYRKRVIKEHYPSYFPEDTPDTFQTIEPVTVEERENFEQLIETCLDLENVTDENERIEARDILNHMFHDVEIIEFYRDRDSGQREIREELVGILRTIRHQA